MRDRVPAGELALSGAFFTGHRQEIMNLIHNAESEARAEYPLERIMDIVEGEDRTVITFTDAHLVHGLGEALATPESMVAVHIGGSMAAWEAALNRVA